MNAAPDPARAPCADGRADGEGALARVVLDGAALDPAAVAALADGRARPAIAPAALRRAERSWHTARELAATGRLYGRHTGVGAHRMLAVGEDDRPGQDLRLLRSHAGGVGALLPARHVRAMLAVRANQVLAGGSGLQPAFAQAMAEALRLGVHPAVNEFGAVGTGDLTALAQTGLTLIGERPWITPGGPDVPDLVDVPDLPGLPGGQGGQGGREPIAPVPGPVPRVSLAEGDALALMSSSALTIGQAALASHDMDVLLAASHAVAALSLAAVDGSAEAYAAPVHAARPYPGAAYAAAQVRRLLGLPDRPPTAGPGRRIQDPYGFRVFPQVHGAALDAAAALRRVVAVEANSPSENPLITHDGGVDGGPAAYHHGAFFAAPLGLALDHLNLAVLQTAQLSAARLAAYGDPELTGQRSYLAAGPAASSGMMILEYSAHSALADLRAAAQPASAGHAVLSRGLEETASFASQAARQTLRAVEAYRLVLACELVAAVRALRGGPGAVPAALGFLMAALPAGTEDRPLTADVATAAALLPDLAAADGTAGEGRQGAGRDETHGVYFGSRSNSDLDHT